MATILPADYILANALRAKNSISFKELWEMRKTIEAKCPGVVVQVSSPAIHSALTCYPELFEQKGGQINQAKNSREYFSTEYVDHRFKEVVPAEVHLVVKKVLMG